MHKNHRDNLFKQHVLSALEKEGTIWVLGNRISTDTRAVSDSAGVEKTVGKTNYTFLCLYHISYPTLVRREKKLWIIPFVYFKKNPVPYKYQFFLQ